MRKLTAEEIKLVSGGWASGWEDYQKYWIKDYLNESKDFYKAAEKAEEENLLEGLQADADEQNGTIQPSAPPIMSDTTTATGDFDRMPTGPNTHMY